MKTKGCVRGAVSLVVLAGVVLGLSIPGRTSGSVTEEWVRRYDSSGLEPVPDAAGAVAVDGSGNVYVTGGSGGDYATVSYAPDGTERWVRRYNGPANRADGAYAVVVDGGGNVYVTGYSLSDSTGDYATVSYAPDGTERWVRRYNGTLNNDDVAHAVAVDGSGNVYVTGYSLGSDTSGEYATVSYAPDGTERWVRRHNGPGSGDVAHAVAVDGSGNVYVTGESHGVYATVSYASDGTERWVSRYIGPGPGGSAAKAVAVDDNGNVYVSGWSRAGVSNFATVSYAPDGTERWVRRYIGPGNSGSAAEAVAVDHNGNVYVTGWSFGNGTINDYATIKYSQAPSDTTPPGCSVGAVVVVSPSRVYLPITLTDGGSGVAGVKLTSNSTNCQLEWDGPGGLVTAPINTLIPISPASPSITVRAVKLNTGQKARVELRVTDAAGNFVVCDPVIANLEVKNGRAPLIRTFAGIPQVERYVTLQNGAPGLTQATLSVNGRVVSHGTLTAEQVVSLDVARWLRPGDRNVVRIAARGPKGAAAVLTIGDVPPGASAAPTHGGVNREFSH